VHLAVETSGAVPGETYRSVVGLMDFVYQDVKLLEADAFQRWTGGEVDVVLENIAWLRRSGVPFVFRVPLIPGVNDSEADRERFRAFTGEDSMEFLPYNAAAGLKYRMLGRRYEKLGTVPG
jgi:pyruvate formate lyase activating enzyme